MMSSTWKISVFGIVALMLAFGLTAGDAFAHSDGHSGHPSRGNVRHFTDSSITVMAISSTGDEGTGGAADRLEPGLNLFDETTPKLRATEKLDALVFTYSHGGKSAKGTVTLTIPRTWTRAVRDNQDGVVEPGEVTVDGAADTYSVTSAGGGWQVKANLTSDVPEGGYGNTVITYKMVEVPSRAGKYEFSVSSTTVGDGHSSTLDPHSSPYHSRNAEDPDDPPPGYLKHAADTPNRGTITIDVYDHDHASDNSHEHDVENDNVMTIDDHRHPSDKTHAHEMEGEKPVVDVADHSHPGGLAGFGLHSHTEAGYVTGMNEHTHRNDGTDTNDATHTHSAVDKIVLDVGIHTHDPTTGGQSVGAVHAHDMDDKTVTDVDASHKYDADDASIARGKHEHGSAADSNTEVPEHTHDADGVASSGDAHTHGGSGGTVDANASHTHAIGDASIAKGSHEHSSATADSTTETTHTHDADGVASSGEVHTHGGSGGTVDANVSHTHATGDASIAKGNHEHSSATADSTTVTTLHTHDADGAASSGDAHTHGGSGGTVGIDLDHYHNGGYAERHEHTNGTVTPVPPGQIHDRHDQFLNVLEDFAHKHNSRTGVVEARTGETLDATLVKHTHARNENIMPVTDHDHGALVGDPPDQYQDQTGTVSTVDVGAHAHNPAAPGSDNSLGSVTLVTEHSHSNFDAAVNTVSVDAHAHNSADTGLGSVKTGTVHAHTTFGGVVTAVTIDAHTHKSAETGLGSVNIVTAHTPQRYDCQDRDLRPYSWGDRRHRG